MAQLSTWSGQASIVYPTVQITLLLPHGSQVGVNQLSEQLAVLEGYKPFHILCSKQCGTFYCSICLVFVIPFGSFLRLLIKMH